MLARWSGWGATPAIFDRNAASYEQFSAARTQLLELMSSDEYASAERSTINAHYTDAAYVQAIWGVATQLGFAGGNVLEPGCGSGNFIAFATERAEMVGVELDAVTAEIAAALHPRARILHESFADSRLHESSFDLVIGNVPFGDVTLHDTRHNAAGHRIHNHFIVKALHLTRPGGLVALLTSRYTMDAANPAARREMAELADLVGAVRLPTGAHRRAAGTDVVTDVLVFRRREEGRERAGASFERSESLELGGTRELLRMNEYFGAHPEHVLGDLRVTQGDRGRAELGVVGERAAGPQLAAALSGIADQALAAGLAMSDSAPKQVARAVAHAPSSLDRLHGYLSVGPDDTFTRVEDGHEVPYRPPSTQANELRALLSLRDAAVSLLQAEATSIDDSQVTDGLREKLNALYEGYAASYGPINRYTERRTGRLDRETSVEQVARIRPRQGGFRSDPFAALVYALEHFDSNTQSASKATIFRRRVIARRVPRLGADTPADALAICIDDVGEVRLENIARLLGCEHSEARSKLGALVFDEPVTERLVPAAEYLSGNVRTKLALARTAQVDEAKFAANVIALEGVVPRDLGPDEIQATLGAAWISGCYVQQFLREILDDQSVRVEHPGGSNWIVRPGRAGSVADTSTWGTERHSATTIAQSLLEQRVIRIYDETPEGERHFNETATIAAVEKATEMAARFSEWVWENPERAAALARTYNERFNCIVPRSYDGTTLSLPGLSIGFQPQPHQVAAVARIISEPTVGLFHEVGAGKTAEIVMGAMELRRLGLVTKPVVVVPNHMLEQFSREWLQLYPQARLLAASNEDLDREHRRLFVAKCATGDWDAVVMTRSAFERVPVSLEAQRVYLKTEVDAIVTMIERAKSQDAGFSVKRLQRMKLRTEERLKQKLAGVKDPGITFEQLGIDYLFVDEAHAYKNLRTSSNIPGMAVDGSQRASDLHMKVEYLRARHARVGTFATATPIANSMGEAYTMQRYLRPDLLETAGITDFDQWAATFGKTSTTIEVSPDGSGMRMQTRFATFHNVPELLQMWLVAGDIKTAEDLKLPVPLLSQRSSDGQRAPETVVVPPSSELLGYVTELANRADLVRTRQVHPTEDNLLKISSDGRAAALHLRLVDQSTTEPQKVDVAADRITAIWAEHRSRIYLGRAGQPHPTAGALQLVFGDLGTPKPGQWSVYEELRSRLVDRGMPRDAIRFVHEASNDREKAELFAACRDGSIAVLIGSTERMGVGTNVQQRAVALHHLDCPWRPADITQREGRILRQGNANPAVQVLRYVTEGSFDAYLWQTVTRKAQFIGQVMRGRLDVREIDDIGDVALSYNEVKALATGNPLVLEQAQVQAEINRLERLERAHARNLELLRWNLQKTGPRIEAIELRIHAAEAAMARNPGGFELQVGDHRYDKRAEGNAALRSALLACAAHTKETRAEKAVRLGTLNGFAVHARPYVYGDGVGIEVKLGGVPSSEMSLSPNDLVEAAVATRLENRVNNLPKIRDADVLERVRIRNEGERARADLEKPFRHGQQLGAKRSRLLELEEAIRVFAAPVQNAVLTTNGAHEAVALLATSDEPLPRAQLARGSDLDLLVERIRTEFKMPVAALPENQPVIGRLVLVEPSAEERLRAVVVAQTQAHVLSMPRSAQLEPLVGRRVAVTKTVEGLRISPAREQEATHKLPAHGMER